ncbi:MULTISPECIES: penicillin-binding protein 2 [unclassified Brevundimonas]|uniref:penicillin-binding protein 2 n=1 Tax=unclassified Brevundimonas TaxID=2622653 RepID=UPI000CFC262B|nr:MULTISPECIES: penicillin-binding protein 2 [unclassified Brevundimonas]PRA30937.1 penicillin-binding protein 2 [Brevundimonas sp. MYb27]PQZ82804.1 penicillin-binding protein 2 [Brevundimonas sp. MYb31]PRB16801.1 penicillin-binding protein 2 [Brevundimonas sp. MYb52]PRB34663.1 penicillin-binding protein 2 [Brevundimonas sp. MYb46]PRB54771.1 penicillin-binding protein 2 [Brevundimonas sp. MYb33]
MSSEPHIFFSDVNERQGSFLRRTFLLGGGMALGTVALVGRLAQLQIVKAEEYATLATNNQFNFRLVPPPRGLIKDRNGVTIAGNRPSFRVLVVRDETKDLDQTLDLLGQLLPDTLERRRTIIREVNAAPRFSPVPVKSDLTWEEFSKVNLHAAELPGVMADMNEARYYPFAGAYAHVIGYVAKVSDRDVKAIRDKGEQPPSILFNPGFRIGRQGIEKALDTDLRGEAGGKRVEVDVRGRVVAEDAAGSKAPIQGSEVMLTLDNDVQNRALEVFGEESGSCVVMDVRNGDILAMVSSPSFDPNLFVSGVPSKVYRALADYERRPLLDKALGGTFAPGSTFKPVVGLAAMKRGWDPNRRVVCNGSFFLGRRFACLGRHGALDLRGAIKASCNVYFMTIATEFGPDAIAETAREMGFGQTFDIGLTGQKAGLVPDREWRRRNPVRGDGKWYPGETPSYGIGQGALNVNALQLAVYTSRIANGQKAVTPRLIKSVGGVEQTAGTAFADLPFDPALLKVLRDGMEAVTDVGGTGFRNSQLGLGAVRMAGKTGTAQAQNYGAGSRKGAGRPWAQKDHNLFIAYAPTDNPRYAVSVIVQHGGLGGGTAGAPRAREVMKVALLKDPEIRARIEQAGFEAPEDAGAREAEARGEPVDALPLDTPAVDVAAPPPEPAQ